MKKFIVGAALVAALAIPATAIAADLNPDHIGTSCPAGFVGTYHFVNPQTGGTQTPGILTATIGGVQYVVTAYKVNNQMQHFEIVDAEGAVTAASTNLPGKLNISGFECTEKK